MRVWWLTPAGMPVVVLEAAGEAAAVGLRVREAGLDVVPSFYGHRPAPRPPRVGFTIDASDVRLVDEQGDALVRISRRDVDPAWAEAAVARRGTLTYVTGALDVGEEGHRVVADAVEAAARGGDVLGGIVGVTEERQRLPLNLF